MKPFPLLIAALVCVALYFVILDRQSLVQFAASFLPEPTTSVPVEEADLAPVEAVEDDGRVHVVARRSEAQLAENAVVLRGRTEAARQVQVASETSGRIVSEPLRAGAFVEEGQLLCAIDTGTRQTALEEALAALETARARLPEAEAQVIGARAQLTAAEIDANAATRLSEQGFASEARAASAEATFETALAAIQSAEAGVAQARSGIRSAEASVTRAEEEITRLEISAPFAGHLETDTAELGTLMQPGALCATVIELDTIKVVGFVPEAQVDRIRIGATAGARLASGREVVGNVTFLSRSADERTRTFRVEITVENADYAIRDGQTADILVSTEGTLAHLLPASAMTLNDEGTLGVRVVDDAGRALFMPVRMIRDTANGVWLSGLPEQVDIITVGQEFVTDGVPVRVAYEELTQ